MSRRLSPLGTEATRVVALLAAIVATAPACSSSSDPTLGAHLEGDDLVLDTDPADDLHYLTCEAFRVEKQVGGGWVPLTDERPGGGYPCLLDGYYLDQEFVEPCCAACDFVTCDSLPDGAYVGQAVEYLSTGTQPPPPSFDYQSACGWGSDSEPPASVASFQSRAVHGRVRVRARVFLDADCEDAYSKTLEVTAP